jgi:PAS domain S-box-containing protein
MVLPFTPSSGESADFHAEVFQALSADKHTFFDDIASLAASQMGCKKALITLTQGGFLHFKAAVGFEKNLVVPCEGSFCEITLKGNSSLEIPDALADKRFKDYFLVATGLRSYFGVPLFLKSGQKFGTLCVLDDEPRLLTSEERKAMEILSRLAEGHAEKILEQNHRAVSLERRSTDLEERFLKIFSTKLLGIMFWNNEGEIDEANDTFLETIGYSREDLKNGLVNWRALTPPEFVAADEKALEQLSKTGSCIPYEKEYFRKDGSRVSILLGATALNQGELSGACFIVDFSQQKAFERRFEAVMQQAPFAELLFTIDGRVSGTNQAWHELNARLFESTGEEKLISQQAWFKNPALAELAQRAAAGESVRSDEIRIDRSAMGLMDSPKWIRAHLSPVKNSEKVVSEVLLILENITARKLAEQERTKFEVRERAALEASEVKSQFLANMSHEIRTPINGVMGMAALLEGGKLTTEQKSYVGAIQSSANILLTLVNDILDLSKAEAGKLELESIDYDAELLLSDVEKVLFTASRKKGLKLFRSIAPEVPEYLVGDPARLRQILVNLVNNAIKFTEKGQVSFEVSLAKSHGNDVVKFEITDSGIGISPEVQANLFRAFSQADVSTTRKYGGTGLGLSICKHLVELMGGNIGVTSAEGRGSTFWFTVPFLKGNSILPTPSLPRIASSGANYRILLAEDNSVNQVIGTKFLQKLGHTVVVAGNGREAIDALKTAPYDLVFMDCQMPEMDGFSATREIRQLSTTFTEIPIIAMTAYAMKGDRERCLGAGMNDYVTKPIKVHDLEAVIARVMEARNGTMKVA